MARHVIIFVLCLAVGCVEQPSNPVPAPTVTELSPKSAYHSQTILVRGSAFDDNVIVWFNGVLALPDSGTSSELWVRVPYPATTGPVSIRTSRGDSVTGPVFEVKDGCPFDVCIIPYSGQTLTQDQSIPLYAYSVVDWTGRISSDTVELFQEYSIGDDTRITKVLRFDISGGNALPAFFSGCFIRREIDGTFPDTLRGLIQIQDWNPTGIVSGKVSTPYYNHYHSWRDFVFWYRFQ